MKQSLLAFVGLRDALGHLPDLPLHVLQLLLSAHHQLEVVSQLLPRVFLLEPGNNPRDSSNMSISTVHLLYNELQSLA